MLKLHEFDNVLLNDDTPAAVMMVRDDGKVLLEKEVASSGKYPDYEQFVADVSEIKKVTYKQK